MNNVTRNKKDDVAYKEFNVLKIRNNMKTTLQLNVSYLNYTNDDFMWPKCVYIQMNIYIQCFYFLYWVENANSCRNRYISFNKTFIVLATFDVWGLLLHLLCWETKHFMQTEEERELLITNRTFTAYVLNVRITFREKANYNVLSQTRKVMLGFR